MTPKTRIIADRLRPLRDNVFVTDLDSGPHRTRGGILIPDDNMTERGVRSRWGRVYCVGPKVTEVQPGEWVLIEHGRWTNGIDLQLPDGLIRVWRIEWPKAVMLASATDPREQQPVDLPKADLWRPARRTTF